MQCCINHAGTALHRNIVQAMLSKHVLKEPIQYCLHLHVPALHMKFTCAMLSHISSHEQLCTGK